MKSGVEFATYFGQRYAVLPVSEENLIRAGAVLFNRASTVKLGDTCTVWGIDRKTLDAATGMDDKSVTAYGFQLKYGDHVKGIRDIHVSKWPDMPWEDAKKLVILIPG